MYILSCFLCSFYHWRSLTQLGWNVWKIRSVKGWCVGNYWKNSFSFLHLFQSTANSLLYLSTCREPEKYCWTWKENCENLHHTRVGSPIWSNPPSTQSALASPRRRQKRTKAGENKDMSAQDAFHSRSIQKRQFQRAVWMVPRLLPETKRVITLMCLKN